jgi:hypothetical protein
LCKTIDSALVPTPRLGATSNDPETGIANESQSKSDPSPKVNFARLFCEMEGFRFGFDDNCELDSGIYEYGRPEFTFERGEVGGCEIGWRAGSGVGDVDEFVGGKLDERGGNRDEEDGVRSGGDIDGGEISEDETRGTDDLDGSDGDGSGGATSGTVDLNLESVLQCL